MKDLGRELVIKLSQSLVEDRNKLLAFVVELSERECQFSGGDGYDGCVTCQARELLKDLDI